MFHFKDTFSPSQREVVWGIYLEKRRQIEKSSFLEGQCANDGKTLNFLLA